VLVAGADNDPLPPAHIDSVSTGEGPAVGVNHGVINYLVGPFRELRRHVISLHGLPMELGLQDPDNPRDPVGRFTGREDLIGRIDKFVAHCAAGRGGYLVVEAEAGMGKSALATYLAFTRPWPTHVTRVADDPSPEAARRNLAAELIGRWELDDAAPGGLLSAEHDSPAWFKTILEDAAHAARTRAADQSAVPEPVVILVDGIDEAPAPVPGFMPLGLPKQLPPGVTVVLASRPVVPLPAGLPCVALTWRAR
jgi:AAA ATPase domain